MHVDYFCEETAVENVSSDFSWNVISCLTEDYSQRSGCKKLHVRLQHCYFIHYSLLAGIYDT